MFDWFGKASLKSGSGQKAVPESIALKDRGNVHLGKNELEQAADCYRQSIELNPSYAEACNNLGYVYQQQGRLEEAIVQYCRAIELRQDLAQAHYNLGNVYEDAGRLTEAEASYRRAVEVKPDYVDAYYSLAVFLEKEQRISEAEECYRCALEIDQNYVNAHSNLGVLLMVKGMLPEAEASYRRALEIDPDDATVRCCLGLLLLTMNHDTNAWSYYECRFDSGMAKLHCEIPTRLLSQWQGESLQGKSLVVVAEQGIGDNIQAVRYTSWLKERGLKRLTLLCALPLKPLLETAAGVDEVITRLDSPDSYDYWIPFLSLPFRFGITLETIPSNFPYVHAMTERMDRWRDRLPGAVFKAGLVWKGSAIHKNDANRSLPGLITLEPLWSVHNVIFISLQKGQGEEEAKNPPVSQPLIHLGSDIDDLADTAAIIEQLDLVICVDTSIAHLAGAMNKPCWVLLPAIKTDWRWLRDREDTPWYPSMHLFRQKEVGKWDEPVECMRLALIDMMHHKDS